MSAPDLMIERLLRRGWDALKAHPEHVYELLSDLPREHQEDMQRLVREQGLFVFAGPPEAPPVLPAALVFLRQDNDTQGFIGGILDHDPPDEVSFDGPEGTDLVPGAGQRATNAGLGKRLYGPMRVTGVGSNWIEADFQPRLAPGGLATQRATVHVLGGPGAGAVKTCAIAGTPERIVVTTPWDPGMVPSEVGSWIEVRAGAQEVDRAAQPVRAINRTAAGIYERRGSRVAHVVDVELAGPSRTLTVLLSYLVKGMLVRSSLDFHRRGVENMRVSMSDLQRRPEYFPSDALVRVLSVASEGEFGVTHRLDQPDEFSLSVWGGEPSGVTPQTPVTSPTGELHGPTI